MRYQVFSLPILCAIAAGWIAAAHAQQPAKPAGKPAAPATPADSPPVTTDAVADEAAIRANAEKYVEAYNRRDSQAMAAMWSPEAVYMDPTTVEGVVGRDAIAKQFDRAFAAAEDAKLAVTIDSIDFVSPNVAVEKGRAVVTYSDQDPEQTDYTAVHVRRDGQWLIDRVSEVAAPAPAPSNYEHLKELEWMVGAWLDDSQGTYIESDCSWTKNQNFLKRSFVWKSGEEVRMSGMQVIGWDPAAKQIRSWVFDSDGGFAEGKWTRKGNRWFVQQIGTLQDGGQSTATNIITQLDDDSFTWQSIDRTVDGEVLPNVPAVVVTRTSPVIE